MGLERLQMAIIKVCDETIFFVYDVESLRIQLATHVKRETRKKSVVELYTKNEFEF